MSPRRRLFSLLHAFAAPWAWGGLGLAAVLVLFPQGSAQSAWRRSLTAPRGVVDWERAAPAWLHPVEVAVWAGNGRPSNTAWRTVRVTINPESRPFFGSRPPAETVFASDRLKLSVTRWQHAHDQTRHAITLGAAWWWLAGVPLPFGVWNAWRRSRWGGDPPLR